MYLGTTKNAVFAGIVRVIFGRNLKHSWNGLIVIVNDMTNHFSNLTNQTQD